jgi:hypothetical protein
LKRKKLETIWDDLQSGQALADILGNSLEGLELKITRKNAQTIPVQFRISITKGKKDLELWLLDINTLKAQWDIILERTKGIELTVKDFKEAGEKYG